SAFFYCVNTTSKNQPLASSRCRSFWFTPALCWCFGGGSFFSYSFFLRGSLLGGRLFSGSFFGSRFRRSFFCCLSSWLFSGRFFCYCLFGGRFFSGCRCFLGCSFGSSSCFTSGYFSASG